MHQRVLYFMLSSLSSMQESTYIRDVPTIANIMTHQLFVKMPESKISPFLFFSILLFLALAADLAVSREREDPELQKCRLKCKQQEGFDRKQKEHCLDLCEDYIRRKHGGGGNNDELDEFNFMWENPKSPEEKLSECHKRCDAQTHGQERHDCRDQCWEDYKRQEQEQKHKHKHGDGVDHILLKKEPEQRHKKCLQKCREKGRDIEWCYDICSQQKGEAGNNEGNPDRQGDRKEEEERAKNPYVFQDHHFKTLFETEHGRVRILQNFAERSKLLVGLLNHRIAILEANPSTFIAPVHWDAEALFFVAEGKLTLSLVRQDKRESFNLKKGDIVRVPSGTTLYMINRSRNKKLVMIQLFQPVSTPGNFGEFFGPGGKDPESFFNVFSPELLESAFKAKRETIKRVFGKKNQGVIMKASEHHIKDLSHHEEGGIWPFGGESKGSFNIFEKPATSHSNQYGKLYQISANDNQDLRKANVGISYANITKGAMIGPLFNSKAIKIVWVIRGEGYFEMACPHLSQSGHEQHQQQPGTSYERASGKLQKGVLYVVPSGHPVITVSGDSQNLELVCFEVNDLDNERILLAGKKNILSLLEKTALELSLGGVREEESREVIESQTDYLFFKGPNSQQQQEDGFVASA